jgi:hypothetical protein
MVTLEDRILLLFDDACPAWSSRSIALTLDLPHDEVRDELRRMAHKGLVSIMDHRGNLAVLLAPGGEDPRDEIPDHRR